MAERRFRHVLDRHGLWEEARVTPPHDEFWPLANLGFLWMLGYPNAVDAMQSNPIVRRFVRRASREELATFIALLAAIGEEEVMTKPIEALMPDKRDMAILSAVPTNWCDSLLTGPDGIGQPPYDCRHIENLLNGVRARIITALGERRP